MLTPQNYNSVAHTERGGGGPSQTHWSTPTIPEVECLRAAPIADDKVAGVGLRVNDGSVQGYCTPGEREKNRTFMIYHKLCR